MTNNKKNAKSNKKNEKAIQVATQANLIKRLAVYFIDLGVLSFVLLIAILIAVLLVIALNMIGLLTVKGLADIDIYLAHNVFFISYLAIVITGFYSYFWTQKGQTIGMKLCKLRIQNCNGHNISITQSLIRLSTSAFGLGNFLAIFSPYHAFQDTWAECEVIDLTM